MFELIRSELAKRAYLQTTTLSDWHQWAEQYEHLPEIDHTKLNKLLAAHKGIPQALVQQHLTLSSQENPSFIMQLHEYEQESTDRIADFCRKAYFQHNNLSPLAINRAEWLALINKFESLHRHHVNTHFLIDGLSRLRKVSVDSLFELLKKEGLPREAKARAAPIESLPLKRKRISFFTEEPNPLILDNKTHPHIQQALENTGVRVTDLSYASPEKGYSNLMSTASGKKVRPVCNVRGTSLFKPITPYGTSSEEARADFRRSSSEAILSGLPRLNSKRAEAVEFTATLNNIEERAGKRRRHSQSSIMGASARDVFDAHGIAVSYEHKNEHHWAHLIAHFLCDSSEVSCDSDEVINLVASTAAANYNTLKIIESFIRDTLMAHETEDIHIHVLPRFSGESLIPDELVYTLNWDTINAKGHLEPQTNVYYINPQSYARITKCMQESIEVLNQIASDTPRTDPEDEDIDDGYNPRLLF